MQYMNQFSPSLSVSQLCGSPDVISAHLSFLAGNAAERETASLSPPCCLRDVRGVATSALGQADRGGVVASPSPSPLLLLPHLDGREMGQPRLECFICQHPEEATTSSDGRWGSGSGYTDYFRSRKKWRFCGSGSREVGLDYVFCIQKVGKGDPRALENAWRGLQHVRNVLLARLDIFREGIGETPTYNTFSLFL